MSILSIQCNATSALPRAGLPKIHGSMLDFLGRPLYDLFHQAPCSKVSIELVLQILQHTHPLLFLNVRAQLEVQGLRKWVDSLRCRSLTRGYLTASILQTCPASSDILIALHVMRSLSSLVSAIQAGSDAEPQGRYAAEAERQQQHYCHIIIISRRQ